MISEIKDGKYNLVIGSRFLGNESDFKSTQARRIGINMLSFLIKVLKNVVIKDVTSGYRAVDKKVIELFAKDYIFDYPEPITNIELIKNGYRVKEISVSMNERKYGKSSISLFKSIYYMLNVGMAMLIIGIGRKK